MFVCVCVSVCLSVYVCMCMCVYSYACVGTSLLCSVSVLKNLAYYAHIKDLICFNKIFMVTVLLGYIVILVRVLLQYIDLSMLKLCSVCI